ncbi:MAG: putative Zn-dependent protease [Gammaproteobacteria bacterium]|jgi:predicted Zn-dependent protease
MKASITIFFALLLFAAQLLAGNTIDLPDIGDSTGSILSPEFERRLGQSFLNHIRRHTPIQEDPEIETYIQSIGYRLVANSDNNEQQFTFFVINDSMINAFAAPGGIVGINAGVILNAATESELAGVMAHEIVHVTQKHMARGAEAQSRMSVPMMAAMLGAILVATQNPEAGQAAIVAIQGGAAQAQINFTRGNEQEADSIGMQLLERAGFNPRGMPGFFEKLQKQSRYFAQAPEFLRSHPLTTNRIADAKARSEVYPLNKEYRESTSFEFIKAKLMVLSHKDPKEAVKYFEHQIKTEVFPKDVAALSYGHALALAAAGDYDQARAQIRALIKVDGENSSFLLAAADMELKAGNYDEAFRYYAIVRNLYPDYRPVVLSYSEALLQANRPAEAKEVLKHYGKYHEPDLTYLNYLTRAEEESGDSVEAGIANAEYYYLSGETRVALERLRYILQQRDLQPDYYQEERIQARMAFYQEDLELERVMLK